MWVFRCGCGKNWQTMRWIDFDFRKSQCWMVGDELALVRTTPTNYVVPHLLHFSSFRRLIRNLLLLSIRNVEMFILATKGARGQGAWKCISIIHSLFAIFQPFIIIIFVYSYFGVRCAMWLVSVYDLFKIPLALLILTLRAFRRKRYPHTHTQPHHRWWWATSKHW